MKKQFCVMVTSKLTGVFILIIALGHFSYAHPLEGMMSLGGTGRLGYGVDFRNVSTISVELGPEFTYFFFDGLAVSVAVSLAKRFVFNPLPGPQGNPLSWGVGTDMRYFLDIGKSVFPYVGFGLSYQAFNLLIPSSSLNLNVPLGVIIGLNDNLFIDVGLPLTLSFQRLIDFNSFQIAASYLGLRYFF